MTNEQRVRVDRLERYLIADKNNIYTKVRVNDLEAALSLIKENQKKIENTTTNYKNLIADISSIAKELGLEEDATIDEIYTAIRILKSKRINVIEQLDCIKKKDKQIDLMARAIDNYDSQLEINTFKDKEHIKQYFGELAEEE